MTNSEICSVLNAADNQGKNGNRTINPVTKICNECENMNKGNTTNGLGWAKNKDSISDSSAVATEVIDPKQVIPEDIANQSGSELSATDIYTIVTTAIQSTNKKIGGLRDDVQNKIVTLENYCKVILKKKKKI